MARQPKETKEKEQEIYKVKDVITELDSEDIIFIHKYRTNMSDDIECKVQDLTDKQLNSQVKTINKDAGGMKYKYSAWKIIII